MMPASRRDASSRSSAAMLVIGPPAGTCGAAAPSGLPFCVAALTRSARPAPPAPAMARPAMLAAAISPNRLPELPEEACAAAPTLVAGNASAAGRTAGAAAVQVGGTDKPPTMFAWPRPAVAADPPARLVITGKGVGGTGAPTRPGLDPRPAADNVIGVETRQRAGDVEGKRRYGGGETRRPDFWVDEHRTQVRRQAQKVPPAKAQVEGGCEVGQRVGCRGEGALHLAGRGAGRLARAAACLTDPPESVLCWGEANGVSLVADAADAA